MIDQLWLSPTVHLFSGVAVLVFTLLALIVTAVLAWRNKPLSVGANVVLIVAQLALMVQALLGIKLLDQGLGPLQLYIHYLGGLGPLLFFMLFYWLPRRSRTGRWTATSVTAAAFAFSLLAFTIGSMYVAGAA